jgi:hypothetical protein
MEQGSLEPRVRVLDVPGFFFSDWVDGPIEALHQLGLSVASSSARGQEGV